MSLWVPFFSGITRICTVTYESYIKDHKVLQKLLVLIINYFNI